MESLTSEQTAKQPPLILEHDGVAARQGLRTAMWAVASSRRTARPAADPLRWTRCMRRPRRRRPRRTCRINQLFRLRHSRFDAHLIQIIGCRLTLVEYQRPYIVRVVPFADQLVLRVMKDGPAISMCLPVGTRLHQQVVSRIAFCQNGQPKKAPKANVLVIQRPNIHFNSALWR